MQALDAAFGDRAGAIRHARAHSDLLRIELDAAPEHDILALAERLRLESRAASDGVPAPSARLAPSSISPQSSGIGWCPVTSVEST